MKERLDELILKYWHQTLGSGEQQEMEELLLKFPEEWIKMGLIHQSGFRLKEQLASAEKESIADQVFNRSALKKEQHHRFNLSKRSTTGKKSKTWRAVVFFMLFAGTGGLVFLLSQKREGSQSGDHTQWRQVTTAGGMKTNMHLPDGTEIWLNAGSSLKYPDSFGRIREVYLTGEAYFKVKHQPDRPFIIHTPKMDAKVLGTELDVRAYPDEAFSTTALISGKVKVILKDKKRRESFYLKPQQKIVFNNSPIPKKTKMIAPITHQPAKKKPLQAFSGKVTLKPVKKIDQNTIPTIAWRKNIFIYQDETFSSLAKRLSRWYGVQIIIKDSTLASQRFTGRADNISLKKLLHILQMLKPFTYSIKNHTVIIH